MPSQFGDIIQHEIDRAGEAFLKKNRPAKEIRNELDLAWRTEGLNLYVFELRPAFGSGQIMETPVAKATFVKSQGVWKVFWMRSDLKWHAYSPNPKVKTVTEFFGLVEADAHACFFG